MQPRYEQVRKALGWSRAEMAEKMNMDVTTIGRLETGARQMTLEKLVRMAEVTGFTVQYLLGFNEVSADWTKPIAKDSLAVMHGKPVWTASRGWALYNHATGSLVFADLTTETVTVLQEPLYAYPPVLAYSLYGAGDPLRREEVLEKDTVWVEPISQDAKLIAELRGWYHLYKDRLVQNEFGHRFYLDTYGAQWLAFEDCFGSKDDSGE